VNKTTAILAALLFLALAACDQGAPRSSADLPSALPATQPSGVSPALATIPPPDAPLAGPLVGFYIEDSYEDVYFSLYDAGTGAFRVVQSATPIYLGEAQWFDDGCRLFVHGQLTDLHGIVQWSVPPEAVQQIEHITSASLSPERRFIAHIVTGEQENTTDVAIITLSPPYDAVRLATGGGGPRALAWSADGNWLYHTEYDAAGVMQVFRASPNGTTNEQLTNHSGRVGAITTLSPSPDGRYLAYSVQNLFQPGQPYVYQPTDEGWIGIVDLAAGTSAAVRPPKFGSAEAGRGLVWDAAGERLLIIGDSLPVGEDDPDAGRRLLWVTAAGEVTKAMSTADGPGGAEGHIGWVAPLGSIDTLLVNVLNDYYRYDGDTFQRLDTSQAPPLGMELGRRPIAVLPAPIQFPGEAACTP
jgi:hypothetical protein